MPLVSIIIPAFNAAKTLAATLDAIQAQTCTNWELFVINDRSEDDTRALVMHYAQQDPRIRVVANPGKGPSDARNHGALVCATGDILCFCDADDIWCPDKLRDVVKTLTKSEVDAVFGQVAFFVDTPADSQSRSTVPAQDLTIGALLGENPICTTSNLSVRRRSFGQTGGFDPTLRHSEDLEWLIRLVGGGGVLRGIDRLHVYYRTTPGGLSADLEAMRDGHMRALHSAARFGAINIRRAEAIHLRYLARRALRMDAGAATALRFALSGMRRNPVAFLCPLRRGAATLTAALVAPVLPQSLRRALFSR